MELKLSLLGPFAAWLGGEPLTDFRNRKTQALLIYLVVEGALDESRDGRLRAYQREQLMDLLWPGLSQPSAQVSFRQVLYQLRQLTPAVNVRQGGEPVPLILSDRQTVGLHPEAAVALDVAAFLKGDDSDNIAELALAAALYRGDFLADFYLPDSETFEAWAAARRAEFRRLALAALERLAGHHLQQFHYDEAERYARRQLEIDNLRESGHRQLMEALAHSGQRSAALAQYEVCRELLHWELSVAPAAETEALYQAICQGDMDQAGQRGRIRGYELKEKIGEGSYGTVYRAYQPAVDRDVAIKVIRPEYANNPDFIRRFEVEAQTVARLEHPWIVPLYDYWREPDGAYLVLRWLRGGSLKEALQLHLWPVDQVLPLIEQVAAALDMAHRHGVVHRDLKPGNILLDEEGNAYLSDFGIARRLAAGATETKGFAGSPEYVSPEQVLNESVTPKSDIYTFGVMLYEILTGERPFAGESLAGILHKHLYEPLPPAQAIRPELPPAVDEVIQRATAKQPAERYPDALAFAAALRQAVAADGQRLAQGLAARDIENPYKGLRAFTEADAATFFGREALVEHLLTRFTNSVAEPVTPSPLHRVTVSLPHRFLAIVGPSGSGKSSVVKAGLIPALRQGVLPGSEKWFIVEMLPGVHPLKELEAALLRVAVNPPATLLAQLRADERGLLRAVKRVLPEEGASDDGNELLLVIDQFEELFTLTADRQAACHFLDSLVTAVSDPRSRLRVVITLRADFYDRPLLIPDFSELMRRYTEVVVPLTAEELTRAIRGPSEQVGVTVEDALLAEMVADVHKQPGALPLLQFALTELFEQRQGNRLTLAAYHDLGGVKGALGRRAEALYQALDAAGQETARQVFLRLVTLGKGVEDTRRRVLRSELAALSSEEEQYSVSSLQSFDFGRSVRAQDMPPISPVIDLFGRSRLLSFDRDPATRGPTVEVAHEALLREWPQLRRWLEESRQDIRLQRLLSEAAAQWETAGRDPSYLLRGSRLAQFEEWVDQTTIALTGGERAFLDAGLAAREQSRAEEEARRQNALAAAQKLAETEKARAEAEQGRAEEQTRAAGRLRQRAAFLAGALVVAAVLAVLAFSFARSAARNADIAATREVEALTNSDLAATRAAEAVTSFGLAATREVEAVNSAGLAATRRAEAEAEADLRATAEAIAIQERETAKQQADLATSRELSLAAINNLAADPELSMLLALQALETVYSKEAEEALHRALQASRTLFALTGHNDTVVGAVTYSPDGSLLATASTDGTVKVWDAESGQPLHTLPFAAAVNDRKVELMFSDSGRDLVALARDDNLEHLALAQWNVLSGEVVLTDTLPITTDSYSDLALSPDWTTVAVGFENGTAELWDIAKAQKLLTFPAHDDWAWSVAFSPDGRRLAVGSPNGSVTVWDVPASLAAGSGQAVAAFVSPNGADLLGPTFNDDGTRLALGFQGGPVEVWDLAATDTPPLSLSGHTSSIYGLAFDPDDTRLATASLDGTARVWDLTTGELQFTLAGHEAGITRVAFSPDGARLATTSFDGTARIWEALSQADGERLTFAALPGVFDLELSPDEQLVALGSNSGPATVWDANTGQLRLTMPGETRSNGIATAVYRVAFHPEGGRIAAVGEDNVIRVWDAATGELLLDWTGHGEGNSGGFFTGTIDVVFSPDGTRLATAGTDGIAKVWDAATGEELLVLAGHSAGLHSLAYSPDGRMIATSSDEQDTTVKVWDAQTGAEIYTLEGHPVRVWGLAFSPDNRLLATGGWEGVVKLWDMATGAEIYTLPSQVSTVVGVIFTPDGQKLITGGGGAAVRVWDVATGAELLTLTDDGRLAMAVTGDGRHLYASHPRDGVVRVYTLPLEDTIALANERLTRTMTVVECQQYLHLDNCPDSTH